MRYQNIHSRLLRSPRLMVVMLVLILAPVNIAENSDKPDEQILSELRLLNCETKGLHSLIMVSCDDKGLTSVPTGLPLKSLFELALPNNALTAFPCMALPYLNRLKLTNNKIAYFPWKCLKNIPNLAHLDLSHNQISCVNLFQAYVPLLRKIDLSHNSLTSLSLCDLGFGKSNVVQYDAVLGGNPFHCDCRIAWIIDIAKLTEACRYAASQTCENLYESNSLAVHMYKDPPLFRCSSPSDHKGAGLFTIDISRCLFLDETGRTVVNTDTCSPERFCPNESTDLPVSTALTLSLLPSEIIQAEIHNISQKDAQNGTMALSQVASSTAKFELTEEVEKTSLFNLVEQTSGKTHGVSVTEVSVSETIGAEEPPPKFSILTAPGWALTVLIVGAIVVFCGTLLAVYAAVFKNKLGKNVSHGNVNNTATGQAVNNISALDPQVEINDAYGHENSRDVSKREADSNGIYETIPDDDKSEAYAMSPYVFDVPQYGIVDMKTNGKVSGKGTEGTGSHDVENSEHIYGNGEVL
ncbi:hypothetical protein Bbelb_086860 [Branchiostoma belcheri]|nr:hypothetical protein Bbelb_086860 [Branchiostoma belcheri]